VVQVEGLRSYKAIAFISRKGNMHLSAKAYSELRISLQRKNQAYLRNVKSRVETRFDITQTVHHGDEEWKK